MKIKTLFHRKKQRDISTFKNLYTIEFDDAAVRLDDDAMDEFCTILAYIGRAQRMHDKTEPELERVVFSGPATICFWTDGTKTIAKQSKYDYYDKEKGLCVALLKKYMGSVKVIKTIQKYCEED